MKVYYLSVSTFSDNQFDLLRNLSDHVDITYGVIFPHVRANFTETEVRNALQDKPAIKIEPFHLKYRFRDPRLLATYMRIVRAIRKADPDIIYFTNYDQIYINLLLLLVNRSKAIIGFHDVENHSNTKMDYLTNVGKRILFKNFRNFHTYSQSQEQILKSRYPSKKIFTIPLPLIGFGPKPATPSTSGITRFLFFGNILHYKGLDILLRSVSRVAAKNSNFRLVVAGRTDEWDKLYEPLIEHKQVVEKHIRFIANTEIPVFYHEADYVVLPYRDTTQSGPLMISYNYNVPVIASNAVGFREFVNPGTSGYMFDLADETDLDRVLLEAINRPREEYEQLKQNQAAFIRENFSIETLTAKYLRMFDTVAASR